MAVILGCSVFTTIIGIYFSTREISSTVSQDLILVGRLASDMIISSISKIKQDVNYVGDMMDRAFKSGGLSGLAAAMAEEVEPRPNFISLAVIFPDGTMCSAEKSGYIYAKPAAENTDLYLEAAPKRGVRVADSSRTDSGEYVIRCYKELSGGAIFTATLRGNYFSQLIANSNYGVYNSGRIFLVDGLGQTISDSRQEGFYSRFELFDDSDLSAVVASSLRGTGSKSEIVRYSDGDIKNICAYTPIIHGTERWMLFLTVPISDTPVSKMVSIFIISGVLFLALGSLASVFLSGMQVKPYRELDRRNEELAILKKKAEDASNVKSEFLSNMSHEIRTPLNAVIGMTAIAKTAQEIERKDYCLTKVEEASRHLMGVINDILDMSKIDANKFELSPVDFCFEEMLRKVSGVIAFRADEKHLSFSVMFEKEIPAFLNADEQRLSQVITNLLSNAVKFTPRDGAIRLTVRLIAADNDEVELEFSVRDTGIGISEEQKPRLFQAFSQADSSISRKFGGTGLGLVISKRIVEMMNRSSREGSPAPTDGGFRVESEPGKGSNFIFTIRAKIAKDFPSAGFAPPLRREGLRLLTIDADKILLGDIADFVSRLGLVCVSAENETAALEIIGAAAERGAAPFDVCFIGTSPDALALAGEIKKISSETKVIFLVSETGWAEIEEQAKAAGITAFLPKPSFPLDISQVLNACFDNEQQKEKKPPAGNPTENPAGNPAATGEFKGKRLLLAEDVEINREIVTALLEPTGIEIVEAENGRVAADLFKARPRSFDVIFMDVQMPELDGYAATREIRAIESELRSKEVPIIAMTANVFREDIEKCLAAGMSGHIGKPISFYQVLELLRNQFAVGGTVPAVGAGPPGKSY
jgi:signal transduction histidine kinase/DNA-binding NarL/FixJ family response regulator